MKVKKFFFMLAAMLLTSVCAMAQSNNTTPLKGDVNGDGTVDAADLAAVLKIMKEAGGAVGEKMCYWYAGTNDGNEITESNFTDVASRIPESEIPETGFVSALGQYVYFVMPNTKRLTSLVDADGLSIDYDCTDAFGYHIYKTESTINGNVYYAVEQIIYYWYAGQTPPTSMSSDPTVDDTNFTVDKWHTIGSTGSTSTLIDKTITGGTWNGNNWHVAVPTELGLKPTASDNVTPNPIWDNEGTIIVNGVSYTVWNTNSNNGRCSVNMSNI